MRAAGAAGAARRRASCQAAEGATDPRRDDAELNRCSNIIVNGEDFVVQLVSGGSPFGELLIIIRRLM